MKFGVCESTAVLHSVLFCLFLRSNLLHVKVPNIDFFFLFPFLGCFFVFFGSKQLDPFAKLELTIGCEQIWYGHECGDQWMDSAMAHILCITKIGGLL
jgi:hypothetical protein